MVNKNHDKKGRFSNKVNIDWGIAARLAQMQCTAEEIAHALGISRHTLYNRCPDDNKCPFPDWLVEHSLGGKASLRRMMWEKAEGREGELIRDDNGAIVFDDKGRACWKVLPIEPNTTMQIFLSKNILGYSDHQEMNVHETFTYRVEDLTDEQLAVIARGGGRVVAPTVGPMSAN